MVVNDLLNCLLFTLFLSDSLISCDTELFVRKYVLLVQATCEVKDFTGRS